MTSTTIRVSHKTHEILSRIALEAGVPILEIAERAAELLRREHIFDQAEAAYADLSRDATAAAMWTAEVASMDGTAGDGLLEY